MSDPAVWFIRSRGREYGPLTGAALRSAAEAGRVGPDDGVKKTGGPWRSANEVKGLFPSPAAAPPADGFGGMLNAAPDADTPPAPRPAPEKTPPPAPDPPPPARANDEPSEVIDVRDLAAAGIGDDPDPPPTYANLRVYSAYLKVTGIILYVVAGLILLTNVLLALFLPFETPSVLLRILGLVFAVLGGIIFALPVAVAGFLLRCLSEGVGLLVNLATDTRAVRGHACRAALSGKPTVCPDGMPVATINHRS